MSNSKKFKAFIDCCKTADFYLSIGEVEKLSINCDNITFIHVTISRELRDKLLLDTKFINAICFDTKVLVPPVSPPTHEIAKRYGLSRRKANTLYHLLTSPNFLSRLSVCTI